MSMLSEEVKVCINRLGINKGLSFVVSLLMLKYCFATNCKQVVNWDLIKTSSLFGKQNISFYITFD